MKLSQRRAESVVNYLVEKFGIEQSRLSAKGYGKTKPIADNSTDAGRQKNRRINAVIDCAIDIKELASPPERLCMTLKVEFATIAQRSALFDEVDKIGEYEQIPTTTAVIEGTPTIGALAQHEALQRRAESVVNYRRKIQHRALPPSVKGYGSGESPITAPEGRQQSRESMPSSIV
jgi:OOP family OmpA-OmpF porin